MSFGFSVSDVATLITLTNRAHKGWRDACGTYTDITGSLRSLEVVLKRVRTIFDLDEEHDSASLSAASQKRLASQRSDLSCIIEDCNGVVTELKSIVQRHKSLAPNTDQKTNWDRISLGTRNLTDLRVRLNQHVTVISAFMTAVELETMYLLRQELRDMPAVIARSQTPVSPKTVDTSWLDSDSVRDSIMTNYEGDDKLVWRRLRAELVNEGIKSDDIQAHQPHLLRWLKTLHLDGDAQTRCSQGRSKSALGTCEPDRAQSVTSTRTSEKARSVLGIGQEERRASVPSRTSVTHEFLEEIFGWRIH